MQTIFMFVGLLTLVFSGVSDAQSVDAGFNDTRCSDGRVVCPNDPLLYTCTIINSGSGIATVTLPSGPGIQIDDENQTSVVGAVSLPAGVKLQFYDARISDGKVNYTISLALERADLINNSMVSCDTHAAGSTPILKNCVFTMDPPGPPEGLRQNVSANTESSVVAEWRSPGSTGGNGINISDYTVSTSGVRSETVSGDGRNISHNITGLDYNTSYTVSVTAINSCGLSSPSSATTSVFIEASKPEPPTSIMMSMECIPSLSDERDFNVTWEMGVRDDELVYPGVERATVNLFPDGSNICTGVSTTSCSGIITEPYLYTVMVTVTNDVMMPVSSSINFDSTALIVEGNLNEMLPCVNVTVNDLCVMTTYIVTVGFGVRENGTNDCSNITDYQSEYLLPNITKEFCVNTTAVKLPNDNEEYCVTTTLQESSTPQTEPSTESPAPSTQDPLAIGAIVGIAVAAAVIVIILIVKIIIFFHCYKKKICCFQGESTDQALKELRSSSNPASPLVKETSMEEGGPNTISRTPHPTTGELYTEVQPNKTKKSDQTDSAIVYQDPSSIEHQTAPGGEEYAMPQRKSGKKKKEQEPEDGLTEEEKSALYSVPDKKGQKAKSQGLLYTEVSIGSSSRPAPPSQGSNYADIQHN